MKIKSRTKLILASLLAAVTLIGAPLSVYAGYAPSGRTTFQCITPTNCPGANYVTFNSFTNASNYGDERAFFDGKDAHDTSANGYLDNVAVHDGQLITLRVYIHNNANPNAIGVGPATAKNTRMQVLLPIGEKTSSFAAAAVSADNANPGTVSDTINFSGASPFSVSFDSSKAVQITYRPNGSGGYTTQNLPSASFVNDHLLNANFGDWKGCFNYAALVTMTVKVHMPNQPPKASYKCDLLDVVADVNRSVKISTFNTTAKNGAVFKDAIIDWGDGSAQLTTANPVGQTHKYAKDGTYTIQSTARFTLNGEIVTSDGPACAKQVTFTHNKPPKVTPPPSTPPTPPSSLVNTGPGSAAGLFAVATAAGVALYRRLLSRRLAD